MQKTNQNLSVTIHGVEQKFPIYTNIWEKVFNKAYISIEDAVSLIDHINSLQDSLVNATNKVEQLIQELKDTNEQSRRSINSLNNKLGNKDKLIEQSKSRANELKNTINELKEDINGLNIAIANKEENHKKEMQQLSKQCADKMLKMSKDHSKDMAKLNKQYTGRNYSCGEIKIVRSYWKQKKSMEEIVKKTGIPIKTVRGIVRGTMYKDCK